MKTIKKALIIILAFTIMTTFCSCDIVKSLTGLGGSSNGGNIGDGAIVGAWKLVDGDGGEYGVGLLFNSDGTLGFSLDLDLGEDFDSSQLSDSLNNLLGGVISITYDVKSSTSIIITTSAFFGLASENTEIEYSLDGDSLVFDGSTYERVQ